MSEADRRCNLDWRVFRPMLSAPSCFPDKNEGRPNPQNQRAVSWLAAEGSGRLVLDGYTAVNCLHAVACGCARNAGAGGFTSTPATLLAGRDFCNLCSTDAPMNAANKGCGSSGFDLNSGWNWHPKNHGCSGASTIST